MSDLAVLAPIVGVGIGMAAAYGATHTNFERRLHFVKRDNIREELKDLDIELGAGETCVECGRQIEPEDIGTVYLDEGEYKIVCDRQVCLDTYDID